MSLEHLVQMHHQLRLIAAESKKQIDAELIDIYAPLKDAIDNQVSTHTQARMVPFNQAGIASNDIGEPYFISGGVFPIPKAVPRLSNRGLYLTIGFQRLSGYYARAPPIVEAKHLAYLRSAFKEFSNRLGTHKLRIVDASGNFLDIENG